MVEARKKGKKRGNRAEINSLKEIMKRKELLRILEGAREAAEAGLNSKMESNLPGVEAEVVSRIKTKKDVKVEAEPNLNL